MNGSVATDDIAATIWGVCDDQLEAGGSVELIPVGNDRNDSFSASDMRGMVVIEAGRGSAAEIVVTACTGGMPAVNCGRES